jgi:uncharacterized repeat protein (TIGR01451 family)
VTRQPYYNKMLRTSLVALIACIGIAQAAHGATITVTSSATSISNDGAVTLPEAVASINAGGNIADVVAVGPYGTNDAIHFSIPGAGVHTIALTSGLNLFKPVTIDGYSQPGSSPNTLAVGDNAVLNIEIRGGGNTTHAFTVNATAGGSAIRGLVINGFGFAGIFVGSSGNTIAGNFIGTDPSGMVAKPNAVNGYAGVYLQGFTAQTAASNNVIGGTTPADRNVISGNAREEIEILAFAVGLADGNIVQGNYVGAAADGMTFLGDASGSLAIRVLQADHTVVGGTTGTTPGGACTGACNVILGSGWGVRIEGDNTIPPSVTHTIGTLVEGNFVGMRADGTAAVALPPSTGIWVTVNGGATIGGLTAAARNVIAGHEFCVFVGKMLNSPPPLPVVVEGNFIGIHSAGTAAIPRGPLDSEYIGVFATGTNVTIGGTAPGAGNVIACTMAIPAAEETGTSQISLDGADGVLIQGNRLGTLADGVTVAGAAGKGIDSFASSHSIIGPSAAGGAGGNVIAGNTIAAVELVQGTQNRIFTNSLFANAEPPIDFDRLKAVTPNDPCDADSGTNDLQNFPVITSAVSNGTTVTVIGTLNSTASAQFTVELFADTAASAQARTPLGSVTVTTNASCQGAFSATVPFVYAPSMVVRATATSSAGSTSQLSASAPVTLSGPALAKSFSPSLIETNGISTLTVTLTNTTSLPIVGVAFTDTYPAGLVNAANPGASSTCGGTVTATANGGALSLSGGSIAGNGTCTVSVNVTSSLPASYANTIAQATSPNTLPGGSASATLLVTPAIPTLSEAGLGALFLLLAAAALVAIRRS